MWSLKNYPFLREIVNADAYTFTYQLSGGTAPPSRIRLHVYQVGLYGGVRMIALSPIAEVHLAIASARLYSVEW